MRGRTSLVLIELAVMLFVFALASALCIHAFVIADTLTQRTEQRDCAVIAVQNTAESLKSGQFFNAHSVEASVGGSVVLYCDATWAPIPSSDSQNAVYSITTVFQNTENPHLWKAEVTAADLQGDVLFSLTVAGQNSEETSNA